jgi:hypothetical protein
MVRRNTLPAPTTLTLADLFTRLRAERLEARDTPSVVAGEDVHSLPHLPGMGTDYPIDAPPPAVKQPLLQQVRGRYAVGTNGGGTAQVNVYDSRTGAMLGILNPFGRGYTGGVSVSTGDVTGDGIADIVVGSGQGRQPTVKVFDGATLREVASFDAYSATFKGGLSVAVGDVTGDGRADIVTGAGLGSLSQVKAFDGRQLMPAASRVGQAVAVKNFLAFNDGFRGGVTVAAGDVDGDGKADIAVGRQRGTADVTVFNGATGGVLFKLPSTAATSGASVAIGDVDGDGRAEVVTGSAALNRSTVRVYNAAGLQIKEHTAFVGNGGVNVAVRDTDGDGIGEIIAGSGLNTPVGVKVIDAMSGKVERQFPAVMPWFRGGLSVG